MMLRLAVLMCAVALSGCGLLKGRETPYRESTTQPPLQVPEDLDSPVADQALRVPELSPVAGTRPQGSDSVPPGAMSTATFQGDTLVLPDSPQSVWRRVGAALDRMSGEVEVLERDEAAGRYRVEVAGTRPTEGFFRRLFRREALVRETFELIVEPVDQGARVRVVGGGDLAVGLLHRLRDRLG